MRRAILVVLALALPATAADSNFCMDCIQLQTLHEEPERRWYESDGMCCPTPCYGYEHYDMKDVDVGSGCSTMAVDNETVVGDICSSSDVDKGCPDPNDPLPKVVPKETVECSESPIILDLGNEAYRLTSAADGVQFDLSGNGISRQVSWTRLGVENAFLAMDRSGNGRIDNGAELFGNFTPLRSGQLARHGFEALSELDDDNDGDVDRDDAVWPALLLWTDRNHDGASTSDELQPISGSVVTALGTDARLIGRRDQWGNEFRYTAYFLLREGAADPRRAYYDVFFRAVE